MAASQLPPPPPPTISFTIPGSPLSLITPTATELRTLLFTSLSITTTGTTSALIFPRSDSDKLPRSSEPQLTITPLLTVPLRTSHIYNNYCLDSDARIETRNSAQLLIQNNVFSGINKAIFQDNDGYAVATGNNFGQETNTALVGTISTVPYAYILDPVTFVRF
ncbi:hypothetical protein FRB95_010126 [Tulasnella sp. JGI-2019a]|nr:hypothetical protein FRB95_010126 [Tulasnella sp. JGI-2019a]